MKPAFLPCQPGISLPPSHEVDYLTPSPTERKSDRSLTFSCPAPSSRLSHHYFPNTPNHPFPPLPTDRDHFCACAALLVHTLAHTLEATLSFLVQDQGVVFSRHHSSAITISKQYSPSHHITAR